MRETTRSDHKEGGGISGGRLVVQSAFSPASPPFEPGTAVRPAPAARTPRPGFIASRDSRDAVASGSQGPDHEADAAVSPPSSRHEGFRSRADRRSEWVMQDLYGGGRLGDPSVLESNCGTAGFLVSPGMARIRTSRYSELSVCEGADASESFPRALIASCSVGSGAPRPEATASKNRSSRGGRHRGAGGVNPRPCDIASYAARPRSSDPGENLLGIAFGEIRTCQGRPELRRLHVAARDPRQVERQNTSMLSFPTLIWSFTSSMFSSAELPAFAVPDDGSCLSPSGLDR